MKPLLKSGKVSGARHLQVHTSYQQKEGAFFEVDQNAFDFEVQKAINYAAFRDNQFRHLPRTTNRNTVLKKKKLKKEN